MSDEEDEVDVEVYYFFIIINLFMMVVFIWECSHTKTQNTKVYKYSTELCAGNLNPPSVCKR